ncbi:hypothetical protein Bbelb_048880 [Branchiostoma belcheri]|nr:hypothetical protein Bbelb_048880 [Branchiostoma belcheri]
MPPNSGSNNWSREETLVLISIWGTAEIQRKLDGAHRNHDVFEQIATAMRERGFNRTWTQCRTKKQESEEESQESGGPQRKERERPHNISQTQMSHCQVQHHQGHLRMPSRRTARRRRDHPQPLRPVVVVTMHHEVGVHVVDRVAEGQLQGAVAELHVVEGAWGGAGPMPPPPGQDQPYRGGGGVRISLTVVGGGVAGPMTPPPPVRISLTVVADLYAAASVPTTHGSPHGDPLEAVQTYSRDWKGLFELVKNSDKHMCKNIWDPFCYISFRLQKNRATRANNNPSQQQCVKEAFKKSLLRFHVLFRHVMGLDARVYVLMGDRRNLTVRDVLPSPTEQQDMKFRLFLTTKGQRWQRASTTDSTWWPPRDLDQQQSFCPCAPADIKLRAAAAADPPVSPVRGPEGKTNLQNLPRARAQGFLPVRAHVLPDMCHSHGNVPCLQGGGEDLKGKLTCKICLERGLKVSFQCGHMFCQICATAMATCPACRVVVSRVQPLFFLRCSSLFRLGVLPGSGAWETCNLRGAYDTREVLISSSDLYLPR